MQTIPRPDGLETTVVRVNGQLATFLVDSGANRSAVSKRLAASLGLKEVGAIAVEGITGRTAVRLVAVKTFQVGERLHEHLTLMVTHTPELTDGILGRDLMEESK